MRVAAIEHPKSLILRLAYRLSKKRFGKVIAPLKVLYARRPALLFVAQLFEMVDSRSRTLPEDLKLLVKIIPHS